MQAPVAPEACSEEPLQTPVMAGAANETGSAAAGSAGAQKPCEYLGILRVQTFVIIVKDLGA
jgi:hypothetical protein